MWFVDDTESRLIWRPFSPLVWQALLEEQLSDGRDWVFDTETPNLADLSAYFVLFWLKAFKAFRNVYDPKHCPKTLAVSAYPSETQQDI